MPKRARARDVTEPAPAAEASAVFSKYAYQPPPRASVAVQVARVIATVPLAYEESESATRIPTPAITQASLAARVASFADPGEVPPPSSPSAVGRRVPTHDLSACSSPARHLQATALMTLESAGEAATGGPPAASAELKPRWREQLEGIVQMRSRRDAPVDTLGCERCADPAAPPAVQVGDADPLFILPWFSIAHGPCRGAAATVAALPDTSSSHAE